MADGDAEPAQKSHWERWTGDGGPFYRACAVWPFDPVGEPAPDAEGRDRPAVRFTTGITRLLLRHLPTVVLVSMALYFGINLARAVATGDLRLALPRVTLRGGAVLVGGLGVGSLWAYLVYRLLASVVRGSGLYRSLLFLATAVPLVAGTVHAVYGAVTATGRAADPALTVQAGYFLFVLVAGHLVYDGLALKAENLFARLRDSTIVSQPAYDEFYAELAATVGDTLAVGPISMPRSAAFALVVALGPLALPVIVSPWAGWGEVAYVVYSVVTLFVIAMLYDVFLLVYEFTDLLRRDVLTYQPFHPDDHGGFRDLGRFATRVNVILVVAGGYVAYRFYAEGLLNVPSGGLEPTLLGLTWVVLYVAPVAAYALLALFWLYHSFWRLHRKMEEGRQKRIEELQRATDGEDRRPRRDFSDLDVAAPAWESLRDAPTWPIKRQGLFGILVMDAVPVVITFV
ncbi:hypothetical protein [Halorubrum halodurans]|uniref:Uncharacterized protein n=1 Tax=Halorubrum halodurans TaxID=1383851 RepID=A0A256IP33_9EURY|nr:hypothetical protein [Halorubrum halodurans]OYR58304.1 hypothetical protein DJ70_03645 [Halorubrum halodurans]